MAASLSPPIAVLAAMPGDPFASSGPTSVSSLLQVSVSPDYELFWPTQLFIGELTAVHGAGGTTIDSFVAEGWAARASGLIFPG